MDLLVFSLVYSYVTNDRVQYVEVKETEMG